MIAGVTPAAAEQLRRARVRIATPERWVQGTFAAINGHKIGATAIYDARACLCVNGALLAVIAEGFKKAGGHVATGAGLCLTMAAKTRGFETASKLNDHPTTTHADVLALLDEAIALAVSLAGKET